MHIIPLVKFTLKMFVHVWAKKLEHYPCAPAARES